MTTRLDEAQAKATEAVARALEENGKYETTAPTTEQAAEVTRLVNESSAARKELEEVFASERTKDELQANVDFLGHPANRHRVPLERGDSPRAQRDMRSLGEKFATSADYKGWMAALGPAVFQSSNHRIGNSPPLSVGSLLTPRAALITGQSATSGGALFMNDEYPNITELGRRPLTVRDVITNGTTDSDTVEFVRITTETNAAAPVAEATATGDGSGAKPESTLAFERVTTPVKVVAHWIPATKMALSDAGQLRTLIDAFLRYGLEEELEDQIVNGDGVGQNFTGIFATTGTQTQAWDTNILTTTRKAKTLVSTVGRRTPTAYLLSPTTWETIDLLQDNEARYYAGGPFTTMQPHLWGLPVVLTEALPTGYSLVGDMSQAVLWDRQQATISVSDSHSDFFIRNLVAILAEMRAAFGVLKPNAFVEIDTTA